MSNLLRKTIRRLTMIIMIFTAAFNAIPSNALAVYHEKSARTNINKVNPLFKENIENYQQMQIDTDKLVKSAKKQAASGDIGKLPQSKNAAIESDKLSKIGAMEARSLGRQKQLQEKDEDNIFVDYDSDVFKGHKKDADKIISATANLLENLLSKLKDIGVDCKETDGNKLSEPEYRLKLKKEKIKNTHYNKAICELPKNKYICHDFLKAKCIKKGKKWGQWQDKSIAFSGRDIYFNHYGWVYTIHWKRNRRGVHMKSDPVVMNDVRNNIAARLGVTVEHIAPHIGINARGVDPTIHVRWHDNVFSKYIFTYKYRDGTDICTNWQEGWEQECKLQ